MQLAGLRRQLRCVGVVGVVGVRQAVWHGRANAHPDSDDAAGLWWHGLPVAGGIAAVQHTGLPDSLCGVGVDGLVHVLQVVWHGCAIANPLGHHATGLWRRGVPGVGAIAAVQRPKLPRELCGGLVVVVVDVQPVMWRRCANANALGGDPRGVRWRGMPGPDAVPGVQHAKLSRQLRRVGMVGVVLVLGNVRWRCPSAIAHRARQCPVLRHCLPGLVAKAIVQHAALPRQLPSVGLVGLVGVLGSLRRRQTNRVAYHCAGSGVWWHSLSRVVSIASVQHARVPTLGDWRLVDVLQAMRLGYPNPSRVLLGRPRREL